MYVVNTITGEKHYIMKYKRQERVLAEAVQDIKERIEYKDEFENVIKNHFFWKSGSPFSQWHPSKYELKGFHYVNAEQGMMHGKALLFKDEASAKLIMEAVDPREMKKFGRLVIGFNEKTWKQNREEIVYMNNMAKFTQNAHLLESLMNTTGNLVEASPLDKIWGIGLHENVARNTPEERWPGLNLLGKVLTRVRDELRGSITAKTDVGVDPVNKASVIGGVEFKSGLVIESQCLERQKEEKEEEEGKHQKERDIWKNIKTKKGQNKRAKKIRKKMKQISELKVKDPSSLNENQRKKVALGDALRKELADLGL